VGNKKLFLSIPQKLSLPRHYLITCMPKVRIELPRLPASGFATSGSRWNWMDSIHLPWAFQPKEEAIPRKFKVILTAMPNTESSTMVQMLSQSNSQRNMSAIDSLFSQSSVTTLPKKLNPKVVVFIHSSTMGLKVFD